MRPSKGGGDGDSRINVRGFDQRNIAVMVNGVPVNNMETGWVYWVDWDVLSDVTSSIQVQRGLGASNLAIASVGGTLNIITDAARQQRGFKIKQEAATSAYYKTTVNFSSGSLNEKTALSMGISRKVGNGIPDQTWTEGWAYFGALSFLASETHKFELFVVGTPQRHGHRLFKQPIGTFDADYARSLGAGAADAKNYGVNYNPNWGYSPFSSYREFFNGKVRHATRQRGHYGTRELLSQNASQFELVLDAQRQVCFVQCLLLGTRQGRRPGAPGRQSGNPGRRQHRLATRGR